MNSEAQPIRAPQGAIAWTPVDGYAFGEHEMPTHLEGGDVVLVVSADGLVRGVRPHDTAPLAAVLRIDGDLVEVVTRIDELAAVVDRVDQLEELHARLAARVGDLGDRTAETQRAAMALQDRAEGADTGNAVEIAALRGRVRRLEERAR